MSNIILNAILEELRNVEPLSIHVDGTSTFVVYGARSVGETAGYPILKITEAIVSVHTYIEKGLLLESNRGSVNLKTDHVNSLILLNAVSYG